MYRLIFVIFSLMATSPLVAGSATSRNVDYLELNHYLRIDSLRSGSHGDSGFDNYYFEVTHYGVVTNEVERRKPENERQFITVEGGTFGEIGLKSLSVWKPEDKKDDNFSLEVSGDLIRSIISQTMAKFHVVETETAIKTEIVMFEKRKKYFVLSDDVEIARATYYPIPATKFDTPPKTNQDLVLEDDKGTKVIIKVEYSSIKK